MFFILKYFGRNFKIISYGKKKKKKKNFFKFLNKQKELYLKKNDK